ncbi:MAG: hypothetical protein IPN33_13975 [Saprospiraceae bacterium]|nr:hypothetical protein [Saprospiraceae bacterium]
MLRLFRTNQMLFGLLLVFYAAALRSPVFFIEMPNTSGHFGIAGDFMGIAKLADHQWFHILSIPILLIHAIAINFMVAEHRLAREVNLFPGLVYILITSSLPEFIPLSAPLLANTFLIIAIWIAMTTYKVPSCADRIFNIGFWVATASLVYFSHIVFIFLGVAGLNIMRSFNIRERLMLFSGVFVPYFLLGVYYFWNGELSEFLQRQFVAQFDFLSFDTAYYWGAYIGWAVMGGLLLVVLFNSGNYLLKTQIQVQKKINLLFWALLIAALSLLVQQQIGVAHLLILAVPLSVLISFNFTMLKPRIAEAVHLVAVAIVLVYQFRSLIFTE